MARKLTNQQVIDKFISIHGDKYNYSKVNYKSQKDKVIIICPKHGEFEQLPMNHQRGIGCNKCGRIATTNSRRLNLNSWIEKAKKVHGNKYDYSKSVYTHSENKIIIICPEHGEFEQIAGNHVNNKSGCPKCVKNYTTTETWIEKAKKVHGNKYDYSETVYKHSEDYVSIFCHNEDKLGIAHGWFDVIASEHLKGTQCRKCTNQEKYLTTETWIEKAKKVHENKYDYSKSVYTHSENKIIIMCPEHGEFEQTAYQHLLGNGCPICKTPIAQNEINEYINNLGFTTKQNNRTILNGYEIDIFIPELNIGIEYCGLYWHSDVYRDDNYHLQKQELAESENIRLIQIFEDEWIYKSEIVKSRLRNILKSNKHKIPARKCIVKVITKDAAESFTNKNHIQEHINAQVYYGLYYQDELISLMSFDKLSNQDGYELLRFCSKLNYSIQGGASKILKHFENSIHKPKRIISYADRRWSKGDLYKQLGFKLSHISKPNFSYINRQTRTTEYKPNLNRIYDCGNYVFEKLII